eukprot:scaffold25579_cov67-Phaeocystis_antarctica.AAC.5
MLLTLTLTPTLTLNRGALSAGQATDLQPLVPAERCGRAGSPVLHHGATPACCREGPAAKTREGLT